MVNTAFGSPGDTNPLAVVTRILREQCECAAPITPDARLVEDLALESMSLLILLTELENFYRVRIDVTGETPRTVGAIVALIEAHNTGGPPPERVVIGNATPPAELRGPAFRAPEFATVNEAWLGVTRDAGIGITFHRLGGETDFFSYGALVERSRRIAGGVAARGVRPGDRVAIVLPTGSDFIVSFFGVLLAGGVAAPLYPPMTAQGMAAWQARTIALLRKLRPRLVIVDERLRGPFAEMAGSFAEKAVIVTPGEIDSGAPLAIDPPRPTDIALIQFSSGTTVEPKPIALSHQNLMANALAIGERYREIEEPPRHNLCWAPLYHDLGLIGNVLVPVVWSARNELFGPQDFVARPWLWLQRLSATGAAQTAAPNFAYHLVLKRATDRHLEGLDLSRLRVALNCAEPIHPATVRAFEERLAPYGLRPGTVIPAYGLAEISLAATIALPGSGLSAAAFDAAGLEEGVARLAAPDANDARLIASGGVPVMGTTIRIADRVDFREFLPEGRVGEIIARSPSVMAGLLRDDGGLDAHADEWLATGDLGFIHDGKLYVSGRKKDLIIYNGRNLYPQHLEESVGLVDGVRDGLCAAVSMTTGSVRDELLIFAETNLSDPERARALGAAINSAVLGDHGLRPDAVHLLEKHSLPRTTSGKIRRSRALELYRSGTLRPIFSFRSGDAS